jgi:hypothetical protein
MTDRIDGWDEISKYMKQSARTLQRWRKAIQFPIRCLRDGKRPRVFALRSELDEWQERRGTVRGEKGNALNRLVSTPIGQIAEKAVFSYPGGYASAVRLYGSGKAYVSPGRLSVKYEHRQYAPPQRLAEGAKKRVEHLVEDARAHNRSFFNGPCARLIGWHHNQEGAAESDTLELVLGPLSWFDFEGANGLLRDQLNRGTPTDWKEYVDLENVAQDGNIERCCKLSNLVGNAITIFTSDGKVGYQKRGQRQSSVPGQLTSSVAENINRYLDDSDPKKPQRLLNLAEQKTKSGSRVDHLYRPKGIPHPLASVRRGLQEETSRDLLKHISPFGIKLTGLAFGLDCLHPDLLWIVLVDVSAERFKALRRDRPGTDIREGEIEFVPANFGAAATQEILARPEWVPAGKASLIRAIELIDARNPKGNPANAFDILASAN